MSHDPQRDDETALDGLISFGTLPPPGGDKSDVHSARTTVAALPDSFLDELKADVRPGLARLDRDVDAAALAATTRKAPRFELPAGFVQPEIVNVPPPAAAHGPPDQPRGAEAVCDAGRPTGATVTARLAARPAPAPAPTTAAPSPSPASAAPAWAAAPAPAPPPPSAANAPSPAPSLARGRGWGGRWVASTFALALVLALIAIAWRLFEGRAPF